MSDQNDPPLSILEFFKLVGKLKHLKRTGWVLRQVNNCESIAGHMYRMGVMAFLLDDGSSNKLNINRCIKMAIVHDISECIVGDLTPFCGVSKDEKHKREMEAMHKLGSLVKGAVCKELLDLYNEYTEQITPEAKSVKDLDKLDMLLQAYEYEVESKGTLDLQDFFDNTKGIQNTIVLNWFEELLLHRNRKCNNLSSIDQKKSSVFEFLLLIGKLKHLKRSCWQHESTSDWETVADHMYRTSIMAFSLNDGTSIGLDRDKCIKMSLIKNVASHFQENITKYEPDEDKYKKQLDAVQRIFSLLDEQTRKEFLDLYEEYASQQTIEAKTVKDLEKFENLLQAYEYKKCAGSMLSLPVSSSYDFSNPTVSKWAKDVQELQNRNP